MKHLVKQDFFSALFLVKKNVFFSLKSNLDFDHSDYSQKLVIS